MPVRCWAENGIDCHLPECQAGDYCWELEMMKGCIKPDCLDDKGRCDISDCPENPARLLERIRD